MPDAQSAAMASASALQADVHVGSGADDKSTSGIARDGDRLAVRGPESGGGAQRINRWPSETTA